MSMKSHYSGWSDEGTKMENSEVLCVSDLEVESRRQVMWLNGNSCDKRTEGEKEQHWGFGNEVKKENDAMDVEKKNCSYKR